MYNPHNGRLVFLRDRIHCIFAHYNHFGFYDDGRRNDHTGDTVFSVNENGEDFRLAWSWGASHSLIQSMISTGNKIITAALGDAYPENIRFSSIETKATSEKDSVTGKFNRVNSVSSSELISGWIPGNHLGSTLGNLGGLSMMNSATILAVYTRKAGSSGYSTNDKNELAILSFDQNLVKGIEVKIADGSQVHVVKSAKFGKNLVVAYGLTASTSLYPPRNINSATDKMYMMLVDSKGTVLTNSFQVTQFSLSPNDDFRVLNDGTVAWTYINSDGNITFNTLPAPAITAPILDSTSLVDSTCASCNFPIFLSTSKCDNTCPFGKWRNNATQTCDTSCTNINEYGDPTDRICKVCDSLCASCSITATSCLSCSYPSYLNGTTCVRICPIPTWGNTITRRCDSSCMNTNEFGDTSDNRICKPCYPSCATCSASSSNSCFSCPISRYLYQGTCYTTCPSPFLGNNSTKTCDSKCTNANEYGDDIDRICKTCDSLCKTCAGSPTTCLTCNSPYYFYQGACYLTCPPNMWANTEKSTCDSSCPLSNQYGDPADRICKVCSSLCKSCSITSTNCISCDADRYLSAGTCVTVCPSESIQNDATRTCDSRCKNTNEFYDLANSLCKSCHASCATCSSGSSSDCLTCSSPNFLYGTSCVAACPSPYWGNNANNKCQTSCINLNEFGDETDKRICKQCDSTCETCSAASSTSCLTCSIPRYFHALSRTCGTSCPNTNEYGDPIDRICKACDPKCTTCSKSATNCQSCAPTYYLSSTSCVSACPSPSWGNSSTRKCEASCTNSNEFGDVSDNRICKTCHPACATCSAASSSSCLTCPNSQYLYEGACYSTCPLPFWGNNPRKTCDVNCALTNQYGDSSDRTCKTCDPVCKTCLTTASACTSCDSPLYLSSNTCVAVCPSGNWGNNATRTCNPTCAKTNEYGDPIDRICKICDSTCASCSNTITSCLTCSSPRYLSGMSCVTACPTPYWGNNNTRRCGPSCANTNEFGDTSDNRICKPCHPSCATCSASSSNSCLSCPLSRYLYQGSCYTTCPSPVWGNNPTMTCEGSCSNSNEFGDTSDNRMCKPCHASCATCSASSSNSCLSCPAPSYLYQGACYATCPSPAWGNNSTRTCDASCTNPNEYGDKVDRICKTCDAICKTCTTSPTTCLSCFSPFYLSSTTCVITCPSGKANDVLRTCVNSCTKSNEYEDSTDGMCKTCHSTCGTCFFPGTSSSCLSCASPLYLSETACVTACPIPYWGNNSTKKCEPICSNVNEYGDASDNRICKSCHKDCATCSGTSTNCLSCSSPLYLSGSTCVSTCPSPSWGIDGKRTCDNACTNPNEYGDELDRRICKPCDPNCKTCLSASTKCLSCNSPFYLNASTCLLACPVNTWGNNSTRTCLNSCLNPNEFGDAADNRICKTCDPICKTCTGAATNCTSCNAPLFLSSGACVPTCPQGTWGNIRTRSCNKTCSNLNEFGDVLDNRLCKPCDSNCRTCVETSKNCLSCNHPPFLSGSACVMSCPGDTFANLGTGVCVSGCPSPLWGNNFTKTCVEKCPLPNQYGDPQDRRKCNNCSLACLECSFKADNCTRCPANQLIYNGQCIDKVYLKAPHPQFKIGFYTSSSLSAIIAGTAIADICLKPCLTCEGPSSCLSCPANMSYYKTVSDKMCTFCNSSGLLQKGSDCLRCPSKCSVCEEEVKCKRCDNGTFLDYPDSRTGFSGACTTCDKPGQKVDAFFSSEDGLGVCLTNSKCLVKNCKTCQNLYSSCKECEDSYFLWASDGTKPDICSKCLANSYILFDPLTNKSSCLPKRAISGKLSNTVDPQKFTLTFNDTWEDRSSAFDYKLVEYSPSYKENFKLEIPNIDKAKYSCSAKQSALFKNVITFTCLFNQNISSQEPMAVQLLNVPKDSEFSPFMFAEKTFNLLMNGYIMCPPNYNFKNETGKCEEQTVTVLIPTLKKTKDPSKYIISLKNPVSLNALASLRFKAKKSKARILQEDDLLQFELVQIDEVTFELTFTFTQSITNNPTFQLEMESDDPQVQIPNSQISIPLTDFYYVSPAEQNEFNQTGESFKLISSIANNLLLFSNLLTPESLFNFKGAQLIQTVQLLRFIQMDYPPNVMQVFDEKLSTFIVDYDTPRDLADGALDGQYFAFDYSVYFLNNTGSYVVGGIVFLLLGVAGLYTAPLLEKKLHSLKFFQTVTRYFEEVFVWNYFLNHFLYRYTILFFSGIASLSFKTHGSDIGRFNYSFAFFTTLFMIVLPILIYIKLLKMQKNKNLKVFAEPAKDYQNVLETKVNNTVEHPSAFINSLERNPLKNELADDVNKNATENNSFLAPKNDTAGFEKEIIKEKKLPDNKLITLRNRYKSIHHDLLPNHWIRYYFVILELVRQIITSIIIRSGENSPSVVVFLIISINSLFIILLIVAKPFKKTYILIINILPELLFFVTSVGILGIAYLKKYLSQNTILSIGWMIVNTYKALIYFFIIIQLLLIGRKLMQFACSRVFEHAKKK